MIEGIFMVVLVVAAVAGGIFFQKSLTQIHIPDHLDAIKAELAACGLTLLEYRTPTFKERLTSRFGGVQPTLLVGSIPVSLYERVSLKLIFSNRHGIAGENWLQISRNRWTGHIDFHWDPVPEYFREMRQEMRF